MRLFRIEDRYIKIILILTISLFLVVPIFDIFSLIFTQNSSFLNVLINEGILNDYLINTFELILKVSTFSILIGFLSAYVITMYDFKFKKIYKVLLTLPLAIPVYVGAYTYTSIFYEHKWLEVILRSDFLMNGSVFIYTIFLYPYVYLASRSYLKNNLVEYIEVSNTLGVNKIKTFFKVIIPISWPVIFGSTLFVIFETLSDFAVVEYYGIETISKVISDSWLGLGQKDTAAKVSLVLLICLFIIVFLEKLLRRNKRYNGISNKKIIPNRLSKFKEIIISISLSIIIVLGLFFPVYEMIKFSIMKRSYFEFVELVKISTNTIITLVVTIILILGIASIYASLTNTLKKTKKIFSTIGVIGYSIPSLVLALGTYVFCLSIDKFIYKYFGFLSLNSFLLTSTRITLIIALVIKFIAIAFSNYSNTFEKTNKNIFEASNTLKHNFLGTLLKVNLPILKNPTVYVVIIIFIDLLKELTLTYSLRPFNFKTLSTEVYRYAGNEMIEVAAIPSLVIVGICATIIIYLEVGGKNAKVK